MFLSSEGLFSETSTRAPSDVSDNEFKSDCHRTNNITKFIGVNPSICLNGVEAIDSLPGVPLESSQDEDHCQRVEMARNQRKSSIGSCTPRGCNQNRHFQCKSSFGSCATGGWHQPDETLILFDWDDTLCPTSSCTELIRKSSSAFVARSPDLLAHEAAVVTLLQEAVRLGGVTIVTMAELKWVDRCIAILMPEVGKTLKKLGIEIVGARNSMTPKLLRESLGDCRDQSQYLKTKAIIRVVKCFYGSPGFLHRAMGRMRSWKNILSIGDSDAERLALQDAVFRRKQRDKSGHWKECRCKTIRFVEEPDLVELTKELRMLQRSLATLVLHDGDVDLDMNEANVEFDVASLQKVFSAP